MIAKAIIWCPFYFISWGSIMKKQSYKLKWVVNPYRRDKRTGVISPIKKSEYAKQLFKVGSGWNEQQTTGKLGR